MTQPASIEDEAKAILTSSWFFYKASFSEMFRLFWLPFVLLAFLKLYSIVNITDTVLYISLMLVQVIIAPWLNAVTILFFYAKTNEHPIKRRFLYQTALTYWPNLMAILFVIGGFSSVGIAFYQIGMWPLILPILWIVTRLILSDMIYVLEKPSVADTLKASFDQTNNKFALLALCLVSAALPMILGKFLILTIVQVLGNSALFYLAVEIASSFVFLFINIILYRVYMITMDNRTSENP